jgi:tol-pal system protein YbgF
MKPGIPAAALGLAALAACQSPGLQQVRGDLDGVQREVWKIQKDNAALQDQVKALRQPAQPPEPVVEAAGLKLRLESMERDLAVLRSRADDSDQRLKAIAEDLRETRQALQSFLQAPAASPPAVTPGAGGAPPAAPPGPIPPSGPGLSPPPQAAPGAPPGAAASATGSPATEAPSQQDLYRQAYADYSRGNYALSLQELEEFGRRAPDSDLADDALFLIGEARYAQEDYAGAVEAYDRLLQAYPASDRAPAGFLKKGLALLELNRTADAVIQLQHVISAYPKSEEARAARDRLRALGLKDR